MKRVFIFSALGLGLILILKKIKKMSKFRSNVIDLAVNEWKLWNVPAKVKEGNPRTIQKLRDYYKKRNENKNSNCLRYKNNENSRGNTKLV